MPNKTVFISYRREDSAAQARSLRENIELAFGSESVFMDTEAIRVGTHWQDAIRNALAKADLLLVVIGQTWLRMPDLYGRRRLDKEDDWVREEIETSLRRRIAIIPALVSRATLPPADALPRQIERLVESQYFDLRDEHWRSDLDTLFHRLDELGFRREGSKIKYPRVISRDIPRAYGPDEIQGALREIPEWTMAVSPLPGEYPKQRTELRRDYRFKRFEDAVAFMNSVVPAISTLNHHPRWENVWQTLTVWCSTWDSGHVITYKDVDLCKLLDEAYATNLQKA
jgi:pterin-4a-carbinolamine dehydratase